MTRNYKFAHIQTHTHALQVILHLNIYLLQSEWMLCDSEQRVITMVSTTTMAAAAAAAAEAAATQVVEALLAA